jgi:glyoxylate/hydroxypyruvate reductase
MLALMVSRNAANGISIVKQGRWPQTGWAPFGFCGPHLGSGPAEKDYTVGFLGFGRISQAVLHRLVPFGITRAIYVNSGAGKPREEDDIALIRRYEGVGLLRELTRVAMDELATKSDIVFVLVPGRKFSSGIWLRIVS